MKSFYKKGQNMNRREFLDFMAKIGVMAFTSPFLLNAKNTFSGEKLNFVLILIDDLGWRDLHCYGSKYYETPNIDEIATQGMRFTDAYSACTVCSPSRAAILTGKYPARLHLTDWISGHRSPHAKLKVPDWTKYLPLEEVTIAEVLKKEGYATASIGKWHLTNNNDVEEVYYPLNQGFDINIAGSYWGRPIHGYFDPYQMPHLNNRKKGEYLTDRLTDEALNFIDQNRDQPFFLYFAHYAVHKPLAAKEELIAKYQNKPGDHGQSNPVYAAMIESVDESVGRIVKKLKELGLYEKTVIIFHSDNGGLLGPTSNWPLRGGKGTVYEGGVRVPLIIRWPGVVEPGSVCTDPVIGIDLFPTIIEMAGIDWKEPVDGVSLVPLLTKEGKFKREAIYIYWHYPHYHTQGATPYSAIRDGDYKLIEFFEDHHLELYNLKEDIGETKNLVEDEPEKAIELHRKLIEWREEVNAQMPLINPDYDPSKEK